MNMFLIQEQVMGFVWLIGILAFLVLVLLTVWYLKNRQNKGGDDEKDGPSNQFKFLCSAPGMVLVGVILLLISIILGRLFGASYFAMATVTLFSSSR